MRAKKISGITNKQLTRIAEMVGTSWKNCMQCGKCSASCPAADRMDILPHQVVRLLQTGEVQRIAESKTIWSCASCFTCSERCPRQVDPARLIEAVRLTVIRPSGGNYLKVDDVPAVMDEAMPQQAVVSGFRKYNK